MEWTLRTLGCVPASSPSSRARAAGARSRRDGGGGRPASSGAAASGGEALRRDRRGRGPGRSRRAGPGRAARPPAGGDGRGGRGGQRVPDAADAARSRGHRPSSTAGSRSAAARPTRTSRSWTGSRSTTPTASSASRAPSIPRRCRRSTSTTGAFSAKYGDRLSSLLVVENRPGRDAGRLRGSTTLSLTDANAVLEGRLPGGRQGLLDRDGAADLLRPRGEQPRRTPSCRPSATSRAGSTGTSAVTPASRFFGLLSREATDAFFEDDRPGEQLTLVDHGAERPGRRSSSRPASARSLRRARSPRST